MFNIILATGIDIDYVEKAQLFLQSIDAYSNADMNTVVCVGFSPADTPIYMSPRINYTPLPEEYIQSTIVGHIIQNGEFLDVLDSDPDDIIIFTDADIIMQRPISEEELTWLHSLGPKSVAVGPNIVGPEASLLDEAKRLLPLVPMGDILTVITQNARKNPDIYNCGVVAARRTAWEILRKGYSEIVPSVEGMFSYFAWMQWVMSLVMATPKYALQVVDMPRSFHLHTKHRMEGFITMSQGIASIDGKVALFRHGF